jgi:hypothetical protein
VSNTYSIVFSFSKSNGSTPLNAVLAISDSNSISLTQGPVQLQPFDQAQTPTMAQLSVGNKRISFAAAGTQDAQSLSIVVAIDAVGSQMQVQLSYESEILTAQYAFLGHSGIHALAFGNNVITFPS